MTSWTVAYKTEWVAPQILTDQLTLSQPVGADYAHHNTTGTHGFSDLSMALLYTTSFTPAQNFKKYIYWGHLQTTLTSRGRYVVQKF